MKNFLSVFNLKRLVEKTREGNLKVNTFLLFFVVCALYLPAMIFYTDVYLENDIYIIGVFSVIIIFTVIFVILIQAIVFHIFTPKQIIFVEILKITIVSFIIELIIDVLILFVLSRFIIFDEELIDLIMRLVSAAVKFYIIFQIRRVYYDVPYRRMTVLVGLLGLSAFSSIVVYTGIL